MNIIESIARTESIPTYLYHGSGFEQTELKPGYEHTKKLVNWDRYESNAYLYATSEEITAQLLGISSKWEKTWDLKKTSIDHKAKTIDLVFYKNPPTLQQLQQIDCWVYVIMYKPHEWVKNRNPHNNIDTEYKTKQTIRDILEVKKIDVAQALDGYAVSITVG